MIVDGTAVSDLTHSGITRPPTWFNSMPETMTDRTWRVDSTGSEPAVSDVRAADATSDTVNSTADSAGRPRSGTLDEGRFIERWNDWVRMWARTRLERFGVQTLDFEMVLHEFTALIASADNALAVTRALARLRERIPPAHRVELTTVSKRFRRVCACPGRTGSSDSSGRS